MAKGNRVPPVQSTGRRAVRIVLRVLRILLVPFLCVAAIVCGLVVGYVYLGNQPLDDVWKWETWKHVFDLVFSP